MNRLSSMMDPSATLPTYQPAYNQNQPSYYGANYQSPLYDFFNYLQSQPDFFDSTQTVSPTPAPAPADSSSPAPAPATFGQQTGQQFDTSGYEAQIKSLQDQIEALRKPQTSTAETVANLGPGFSEQGVNPGTVADGDTDVPTPATPPPPPAALTGGTGFRDVNTNYGGFLGNVNATVDKSGKVTLVSNTNKNLKTTLPAGSYFDSTKNQFVTSTGQPINVGSQFLSSSAPATASAGIQFGDTAADIRREFGSVFSVTDKAKINTDGSITLQGGTKVPVGSYIDSSGVLRSSNGAPVAIKPKDKPVATTQAPATTAAAPATTAASATTAAPASTASAPAAASTTTQAAATSSTSAQNKSAARSAAREAGIKGANNMSAQQLANALGVPVVDSNGKTLQPKKAVGGIIHSGMTNRLKHMTRG
jgi:hypothetical protein